VGTLDTGRKLVVDSVRVSNALDESVGMKTDAVVTKTQLQELKGRLAKVSAKGNRNDRRRVARLSRAIKADTVSITIYQTWNFMTTVSSNYTTVFAVAPVNSSEFVSLAALYDECIVDGGFLDFSHVQISYPTSPAMAPSVIVFDPDNNSVLGSYLNGWQHTQKIHYHRPVYGNAATATGIASWPTSRTGTMKFEWVTPPQSARVAADATVFGHDWSSTTDTNATYGFLKPFLSTGGTSEQSTFQGVVGLHMRFRSRS